MQLMSNVRRLTALLLPEKFPSAETLLALEPEELAGHLLEHFQGGDPRRFKSHPGDVASDHLLRNYPEEKHDQCRLALAEAWSCLVRDGFLVHEPGNSYAIYVLSRRGQKIKTATEYVAFNHAKLFPTQGIHAHINSKVYPLYLRGEYETAIFQSFKVVEVAVREASGVGFESLYGTDLMRKAFHPENGPLTNKTEPMPEREALLALFAGAIGRFKNPSSHRHVPMTNAHEAIEIIQLASHMLRIVDDRK